jgi:hypothetical protein
LHGEKSGVISRKGVTMEKVDASLGVTATGFNGHCSGDRLLGKALIRIGSTRLPSGKAG